MAVPENSAAIDFARSKAADIAWQDKIAGLPQPPNKGAQVAEWVEGLQEGRWAAAGEEALYGPKDQTIRRKALNREIIV